MRGWLSHLGAGGGVQATGSQEPDVGGGRGRHLNHPCVGAEVETLVAAVVEAPARHTGHGRLAAGGSDDGGWRLDKAGPASTVSKPRRSAAPSKLGRRH